MTTIKNILFSSAYIAIIIIVFIFYLHETFDYMGFEINRDIRSSLFIIYIYSILPVINYNSNAKVSNIITSLIYSLLYVPTIVMFCLAYEGPFLELLKILTVFLISMLILFFPNKVKNITRNSKKNQFISIYWIIAFTTISIVFFLTKFYGTMSFVLWDSEMYELRSINSKLSSDLITTYLSGWLIYVFIPVIFIYGLIYKKLFFSYIALSYYIIMYMILASKIVIVLPLFIYLVFKVLNKINIRYFFSESIKYLMLICIFLLIIDYLFSQEDVIKHVPSIVLMRTIGNGGYLMYWYYDFFSVNPYTYYSHVNVVESIFNIYPYGHDGLGKVIGQYYWAETTNANANFWATDGIAALGLAGILLISSFLSIILIFINNITDLSKNNFHILMLLPFISSLANTSLFSSVLTGGLFINLLIFIFLKSPKEENLSL